MPEQLKIFTEQLRNGRREKLNVSLPCDFLDLHEKEVQATSPVNIKGEVYVLDELLMLSFDFSTEIEIPCSICNKLAKIPLKNKNILISIPLSELPCSLFDCSELVREEVVMLIPQFVECNSGACPQRQELKSYVKKDSQNFPFADLN